MTGGAHSEATRELLLVLAVAGLGLVLAMAAAFGPWHPTSGDPARAGLVELHSPPGRTVESTAG
ncbi:hypothetical protein ONA91_10650 [Micromonospora sp. DR5-3]|uniref:hypothetical protein n=1 Tax=unclassified Micromonospora TaxID=2617518 RepID=UPI0011DA9E25|nr:MULTISPECIES: hypothetical protein [unclassified Micromonospora]MCW3814913.1 hypothetical protein [Micromonospora sp. DR5-3]TYC24589.1 hypothetical protein FXF52_10030 [Micromonospora sp. MP36]